MRLFNALVIPLLGRVLSIARASTTQIPLVHSQFGGDGSLYASYEYVQHVDLPRYSLRTFDPDPSVCPSSSKQHTGYLDISDGKHLFFWFFESQKNPSKAPLTLWLNGGPGASSSIGLLLENGPCTIAHEGNDTIPNPYSWTTYSNMIYLDQPVGVGYSYSSDGSHVDSAPEAAEDVYAFLQLFLSKYPEYADLPFHVAAESYGGIWGPHVAAEIYKRNKALSSRPVSDGNGSNLKKINLESVILANGHTDPKIQFAAVPKYVCDGPYALLESNSSRCGEWHKKAETCARLTQQCYDFDTPLTCGPAAAFCWEEVWMGIRTLGKDPYDVRTPCENDNENYCTPEFPWIEKFLNNNATKKALGVPPELFYQLANNTLQGVFIERGDTNRNAAALLPELVNDGVRLLVYAGMTDMAANFMGNEEWVSQLPSDFHEEFKNSTFLPWVTIESKTKAGEARSAGGKGETAGNVTFVKVYEAGHLVPKNQPEAALDLFTRWIFNIPLHLPENLLQAFD